MFPFAIVAMDIAQQAGVQGRAEERLRTGTDVTAVETEVKPQARYDFIWKNGFNHFVTLYEPRLIYTRTLSRPTIANGRIDPNLIDPQAINVADPNDTPLSILHNGGLGFEAVRRRYRLSAYQFGAYGPITTTALLVSPPWAGGAPPDDPQPIIPSVIGARFTLLFLQTQIFLPIRLTRRIALIPGFVYNAFGGADSESRGVIALTAGPEGSMALEVAATKDDRFISKVGGGRITTAFQGDREGAIIIRGEASQGWRHYFNRNLYSDLTAGASVGGDRISGFTAFSTGGVSLLYDSYPLVRLAPGAPPFGAPAGRGARWQLGGALRSQPWIDIFSGELEQRGVGVVASNLTLGRTTLRGELASARVINTPRSVAQYFTLQSAVSVLYRLLPTVSVDGGLRFGYQNFDNAVRANELSQTTFFAGLRYAPLPTRF